MWQVIRDRCMHLEGNEFAQIFTTRRARELFKCFEE